MNQTPPPWVVAPLECYVAPCLRQWFVYRDLPNGHTEHLRNNSGKVGELGSIRHFNHEADARAAALAAREAGK